MTKKEIAEQIVRNGGDCYGIRCADCPILALDSCQSNEHSLAGARAFLQELNEREKLGKELWALLKQLETTPLKGVQATTPPCLPEVSMEDRFEAVKNECIALIENGGMVPSFSNRKKVPVEFLEYEFLNRLLRERKTGCMVSWTGRVYE